MTVTIIFVTLVVAIVCAIAGYAHMRRSSRLHEAEGPEFKRTPILSGVETQLFRQLTAQLPDAWIFPQVSMAALIAPTVKKKQDREAFWLALNKIVQKRVDFAVYAPNLTLIAVIELDDSSHDKASQKEKDAARDALLASAGVPVIRFDVRQWPDNATLKSALAKHLKSSR